ncbi:hypothetical protein D3C73_1178190 [compost metagenome]
MSAKAVGELAQQVQHRPGGDHHQQLWQERLLGTEELRQERGKKQDVLGITGPQHERAPKQRPKARHGSGLGHLGAMGRLAGLLPALPGEIEQVQRAGDLQRAEQLFRGQQQGAQPQRGGAEQADRSAHAAEERRVRATQAEIQTVADHQQGQRSRDQDHHQCSAAEQQPGFQTHYFAPHAQKPHPTG